MEDVPPVPALDLPGAGQSQQGRVAPQLYNSAALGTATWYQNPEKTQMSGKDPTATKAMKV